VCGSKFNVQGSKLGTHRNRTPFPLKELINNSRQNSCLCKDSFLSNVLNDWNILNYWKPRNAVNLVSLW